MNKNDRWLSAVLRIAPFLVFLWMVRSLLVPVAFGALFALLLFPLKRRLAAKGRRLDRAAPLLLTLGALVLVVIPFAAIAARVVVAAQAFLAGGVDEIVGRMQDLVARGLAGPIDRLGLPIERVRGAAIDAAQQVTRAIAAFASGVAASLPGQLVDLFLFVLALYFFLRDGRALVRWMVRLAPFPEEQVEELFESVRRTVHGAILGQLATSLVQGGLALIALHVFRVPGALLLGVLATLLSVLPIVGTAPVTVGATIYLVAAGRPGAAIGMGVAAVLIGVSDNVVRPWVQSVDTRMHPLVTLLAIFGGLSVMGPAGVFLGPVVAAMAVWTINMYAVRRGEPPVDGAAPG